METSDGGGIGVDGSVGTIVWVRRRNGSWWPGRILGHDELSASHLMSPRSGTPVKLLGREDASVDWYNLEKSKRVKSFRCGEFDACIDRAEASQSIPIKKREKYARREDAILHALELEKNQKHGTTLNIANSNMIGTSKRESSTVSSTDEPVAHSKLSSYTCENIFKKINFLRDGDDFDGHSHLHEGRNHQQLGLEHDNAEAIPRMRGLQDFGLRSAHKKRKNSLSSSWDNSCKSVDIYVDSVSNPGYIIEGADQASTSRNDVSAKKKRSYGSAIDEFLVKKRDRRRPLVQVLQSSAKLTSHSFQPSCCVAGTSEAEEMERMGSTRRAKRSRCVYLSADLDEHFDHGGYTSEQMLAANQSEMCNDINYSKNLGEGCNSSGLVEVSDSDCCEDDLLEPNLAEEMDILIDRADVLIPGTKDCSRSEIQVSGEFNNLIREDTPLSGFMFQLHEQTRDSSSKASVSKWSIKGKRNIRNVGKKLMDVGDIKSSSDIEKFNESASSTYESKDSLKSGRAERSTRRFPGCAFYPIKEEFEYTYNENDLIDADLNKNHLIAYDSLRIPPVQSIGHHNRSGKLNDSDEDSHGVSLSVWEPSNLACNSFWEEPQELFDRAYTNQTDNEMKPLLVDVDLKVQSSYQGEHVPLVSLMSRLNGKAIIGHPIQIEILEDGSASHLVYAPNIVDKSTAPKAVWRTARRTAMHRVPRSILLSSAMEEVNTDLFQYSGRGSKPPLHKKAYYHYLKHQVRQTKKRVSLVHHSGLRKFQRKNLKRAVSSSKKTRKLSSLASDEKLGGEGADHKLDTQNKVLEGFIKAEDSAPLVACIPLKVVFSRILEAVGKPSSAVIHHVMRNSPRT